MALSGTAWCGDNGDGTVTVNGLVWLKDAGCFSYMSLSAAKARAQNLANGQCNLSDKSKPGDWRIPSLDRLQAIYSAKSQFSNVQGYYYWSSTETSSTSGWMVHMGFGTSLDLFNGSDGYVWPVRSK